MCHVFSELRSTYFVTVWRRLFTTSQITMVPGSTSIRRESVGLEFNRRHIENICCLGWLTHWGRVTHICVNKLTTTGSDNGLSPRRRQAIIWTNAGILLIRPLGKKLQWHFNRNWNIFIQENAFENIVCEMVSILSRPQCVNSHQQQVAWDDFVCTVWLWSPNQVAILHLPWQLSCRGMCKRKKSNTSFRHISGRCPQAHNYSRHKRNSLKAG